MSVWRRKAIALYPELRRDLNSREYTIYSLFAELRGRLKAAHEMGDLTTLASIYEFAEWSLSRKDLNNAAAVAFYEHVFDLKLMDWPEVVTRLSPRVVQEIWPLWEWLLPPEQFRELGKLIETQGRPVRVPAPGHRPISRPTPPNTKLTPKTRRKTTT